MGTARSSKPWEHAKEHGSEADPLAARFVESLSYDTRLYAVDIRGSRAHAAMLARVGLLSREDLGAIERGLSEIEKEIASSPAGPYAVGVPGAWPGWKIELEDVHMCIEAALIEKIGDAGRRLHTGRSRNDQVALDLRLWIRDAAGALAGAADRVLGAFETLAERDGDFVMPSYTHMQRAQPIAVGGELMAWHAMFTRDRAEFLRLAGPALPGPAESPLGAGAIAGSSLPLDREFAARELGLSGASSSSIEATASRDDALDLLHALTKTALHLSRWAEQWILYCTTEFGFLTLDAAFTTGSSMMPQKRNPDMLELIRGRSGNVLGSFVALLTICKGLPIGYNRDLQEDKRHLFAAYDIVTDALAMAERIAATARFNEAAISASLGRGHLDATSLAEYLVVKGIPFRTAHQIVGALVRDCDEHGKASLSELPLERISAAVEAGAGKAAAKLIGVDVLSVLGEANVVARYQSAGNAGHSGYRAALGSARSRRPKAVEKEIKPSPRPSSETPRPQSAQPALFGNGKRSGQPATENTLIDAYAAAGRTLDDLPYTDQFEEIYRLAGEGLTRGEMLRRLQRLRKAAKLPRVGKAPSSPPKISPADEDLLRAAIERSVGSLGQRDQLPYTTEFDELVMALNSQIGRQLDPHTVWRLVAKIAK